MSPDPQATLVPHYVARIYIAGLSSQCIAGAFKDSPFQKLSAYTPPLPAVAGLLTWFAPLHCSVFVL